MEIAALVATLNRPEGLRRVLQSLIDTSPGVFRVVARDQDDCKAQDIASKMANTITICEKDRKGPAYAWNTALKAAPNFDAYVLAADDLIFRRGWLEATLQALDEIGGSGLVGFNDGNPVHTHNFATHYLMTRDFIIEHHGGVMCVPWYSAIGVDVEASERAIRAGKYIFADNANVFHDWHGFDQLADATYRQSNDRRFKNRLRLDGRRKAGWPDDFEAIIR